MKHLIFSVTVAVLALAPLAAPAQNAFSKPNSFNNAPGDGGVSKPGVPAKPGTEAGLAVESGGQVLPDHAPPQTRLQDETGVQGLPGTESGSSMPPGRNDGMRRR